jgi:NADPH:quinone reductase-like Zn-dependent oxidoreductase
VGNAPGDETALGHEAAGIITKVTPGMSGLSVGDRVVVFEKGCFANRIHTRPARVHHIPDSWTLEEAATIPTAYITSIYSLMDQASLSSGKSVLVHSAAGAVGIAAIQIAQLIGAEVYATVSTPEKREFLKFTFGIADDRIFHSRNTEFGDHVLSSTGGRGVDVVLNSLTGNLLDESFRILADGGVVVEFGKRDVLNWNSLPMAAFDRNSSFRVVDLSPEKTTDSLVAGLMSKLFELIEQGSIKPIGPIHRFGWRSIPAALHFLRPGTHIGKAVLTRESEVKVPVSPTARARFILMCNHGRYSLTRSDGQVRQAPKSLDLRTDGCYLIVSSLRGLCGGHAIYLAQHGAKYLAVMSRSGYADEKSRLVIKQITALGCHIDLLIADVTDYKAVTEAMQRTTVPVVGIIQGAMVLRVSPIQKNRGVGKKKPFRVFCVPPRNRLTMTFRIVRSSP